MTHVIFSADFDFYPTDNSTISYKAGPESVPVRRECADQAIAAGAAVEVPTPAKPSEEPENGDNATKSRRTKG